MSKIGRLLENFDLEFKDIYLDKIRDMDQLYLKNSKDYLMSKGYIGDLDGKSLSTWMLKLSDIDFKEIFNNIK